MLLALYSNNPLFTRICQQTEYGLFADVSALKILQNARDAIHRGWGLFNHPLYGNYRPYQQPFRTILLFNSTCAASCESPAQVDLESLHLIEEALQVFSNNRVVSPSEVPRKMFEDCAEIDFALMQLTLEKAGVDVNRGQLPQQHFTTPTSGG